MKRKPLILVVDDDQPILELMRSVLSEFGFEPATACSGEEALAKAAKTRPDLVLLDIQMPGMSGEQVVERLRSDPTVDGVPILMVSGHPMTGDEARALGADGTVHKPFELSALIDTIRKHLARPMQVNDGQ